ncbi:hypothetical protein FSP39_005533 [Pinctada imbricata]|uniref:Phytanoyl-CoA dioxygenase n=1 Tax=Pinctada imbricata TaxID=66713 RepID=A0AA88XQ06_PINIB|nr:hypothetical protein FSP39_005533 [Pinctada imbricata]
MFTQRNRQELEDFGYTVVPGVLSHSECDSYIKEYNDWIKQFKNGKWPQSKSSLIFSYNVGNLDVTWKIRVKSKRVFEQLWGTSKLLSSVDALAIGRPPENGQEHFAEEGFHWLHTDQSAARMGLHAYQGAVYLENAEEDDWTFYLMKGSHKYAQEFYDTHEKQAFKSTINEYFQLRDEDVTWYEERGCQTVRLPVPKGGIVLWDSRLIHANARPIKGRRNPGRWRYTVFVCMAPAIWATEEDMGIRKELFNVAGRTSHWPFQGIRFSLPNTHNDDGIIYPKEVPPSGRTDEAKRLWGALPYNFDDGESNGPDYVPKLDPRYTKFIYTPPKPTNKYGRNIIIGLGLLAAFAAFVWMKRR